MAEKKATPKKLSAANTKQEMLDAYQSLLEEMKEKKEIEAKPEERREEKKVREALESAGKLTAEGVIRRINDLKVDIGKTLSQISDSLEEEVRRFENLQTAVSAREMEIRDLYQIEQSSGTLTALIEAQNRKKAEYEENMSERKAELEGEIEQLRDRWENEKAERERETKEWNVIEKKRREREREEFQYTFERDKKQITDQLEDEKARLEKEIQLRREELGKTLQDREKNITEKETELAELRKRADSFPKELENTVNGAVKEISDRLKMEAKNREELMKASFEGERNVLNTKISALEKTVKEQTDSLMKLNQQLEKAYQKIEDVAVKTIEGSSQFKAYGELQQLLADHIRKPASEK